MKPFTMHAVLKYRRQLEDKALQNLTRELRIEAQLQEEFQQAEEELAGLYTDLEHDQQRGISVDRLILFHQRIDLVKDLVAQRQTALKKQQAQVAKKRQLLLKASQDRKVIEKLKEQQNATYKRHLEKLEAGMLDEIAVLSHERRRQQ
ncbi:flagellar export protein FliJ [Desulfobulbus propionicus]|jgi:flagellar FliJ protein